METCPVPQGDTLLSSGSKGPLFCPALAQAKLVFHQLLCVLRPQVGSNCRLTGPDVRGVPIVGSFAKITPALSSLGKDVPSDFSRTSSRPSAHLAHAWRVDMGWRCPGAGCGGSKEGKWNEASGLPWGQK